MTVTILPLEGEKLERGADRLRTLVYSGHPAVHDTEWHHSVWSWLGRHPLADDMHRWVLVAEGGEVVGHLAALPQHYRVGGRRVVAHTPADYQVLPGYGFHALSLMLRFFRTVENCFSVDQVAEAVAIERRFGVMEAGTLSYWAKLLDPTRIPRVPVPLRPLLAPARWVLEGIDVTSSGLFGNGPSVVLLNGFDNSFDDLFECIATTVPCVPEKDAAFLRWRYGTGSPTYPVVIIGVRGEDPNSDALLGYAVLRVGDDGDNGYLLDLTVRPGRDDVAWSLLREAIAFFVRAGVYIVRYRFASSATSPRLEDLRNLGFFSRPARSHTLLTRFADGRLQEAAIGTGNWSYSVGDGEASFWVT